MFYFVVSKKRFYQKLAGSAPQNLLGLKDGSNNLNSLHAEVINFKCISIEEVGRRTSRNQQVNVKQVDYYQYQGRVHLEKTRAIIGDGDRKRGVHAAPPKNTNVLFLEKIAPPSTS